MIKSKKRSKSEKILSKEWYLDLFSWKYINDHLLSSTFIYVVLIIIIYALVMEITKFNKINFLIFLLKAIFMILILIYVKHFGEITKK